MKARGRAKHTPGTGGRWYCRWRNELLIMWILVWAMACTIWQGKPVGKETHMHRRTPHGPQEACIHADSEAGGFTSGAFCKRDTWDWGPREKDREGTKRERQRHRPIRAKSAIDIVKHMHTPLDKSPAEGGETKGGSTQSQEQQKWKREKIGLFGIPAFLMRRSNFAVIKGYIAGKPWKA